MRSTTDVRQIRRVQALLWLTEGDSVPEVADRLRVSRRTVYNWVTRFEQRKDMPLEQRVADGARSGRPATALKIINDLLDAVIDDDLREYGYQSTVWTAGLLRRYLSANHQIEVAAKALVWHSSDWTLSGNDHVMSWDYPIRIGNKPKGAQKGPLGLVAHGHPNAR